MDPQICLKVVIAIMNNYFEVTVFWSDCEDLLIHSIIAQRIPLIPKITINITTITKSSQMSFKAY
ncbi:hypothetical protein TTHERM_000578419 (macronuclear) [Tetrahymena thermophila SB210]|uniref:Uncharacterized protein n=1 Tax=Tetrahymena thermophila (strain SB210) TaxID=312017 RepID=W7X077_TETTS|nr:hypothetical protein TTHERM_000578419 [Tetrahymena thermophila SB210]EWS72505.1 hypothetical protein TTHERM_000578419 [Tetrahymena thermophila SB210]|eukprot:XP_012654941.1 hypothetical protein TTHERM_000578419 [Tetrahymena thermophila SB210]